MTLEDLIEYGEFKFRLMGNSPIWECVNQSIKCTPVEILDMCGVELPEDLEFGRWRNYDLGVIVEFRQYNAGSIRINVLQLR